MSINALTDYEQYIQAREFESLIANQPATNEYSEGERLLTESQLALVSKSDTLFIATSYKFDKKEDSDATHGVDMSHRGKSSSYVDTLERKHHWLTWFDFIQPGGKPGFVKVSTSPNGKHVLEYPDYLGILSISLTWINSYQGDSPQQTTGNFMFNTIGNLVSNPNAGLLFLDFENGIDMS